MEKNVKKTHNKKLHTFKTKINVFYRKRRKKEMIKLAFMSWQAKFLWLSEHQNFSFEKKNSSWVSIPPAV